MELVQKSVCNVWQLRSNFSGEEVTTVVLMMKVIELMMKVIEMGWKVSHLQPKPGPGEGPRTAPSCCSDHACLSFDLPERNVSQQV